MFSWIKETVSGFFQYMYINYSWPISWALSFFINRFVTRVPGESYRHSAISAGIVGGVAAIDFTLRSAKYTQTYAITYATIAMSYVFPIFRANEAISTSTALISSAAVGTGVFTVVNQGYVSESVAPVATGIVNYNIHDPKTALVSVAGSVVDEAAIHYNITNKHYLSVFAISQGIASCFIPNKFISLALSGAVSAVVTPYEKDILEFFLPIESVKRTYEVLVEAAGPEYANRMLETSLVITANMEISSGVLYLQIFYIDHQWFSLLKESCDNKAMFPRFISFSGKAMGLNTAKILAHGMPATLVNNFVLTYTKKSFKDKFFANKLYKPNNFMVLSNSNFTAETYSNDISSIITIHWSIFQNICFYSPSVVMLTSFGKRMALIPIIALVDGTFTYFLNVIQDKVQTLNEDQTRVFSVVGVKEKHDVENAHLVVHGNALGHVVNQWQGYVDLGDKVRFDSSILMDIYNSLYNLHSIVVLWGGTPIFVSYLVYKDIIAADHIIDSIMAVKGVSSTLLIKTKRKKELGVVDTSLNRLQRFYNALMVKAKYFNTVSVSHNSDSKVLKVENITYVRGDKDGNVTVSIPHLSFGMGKKYVVTGGNGSGKSSFLLMLNLLEYGINDKSFLGITGSIEYPAGDLVLVTQKEYCPLHANMFDWLIYPSLHLHKEREAMQHYRQKVVALMEEFKFSSKNLTVLEEEFHSLKKNWCMELSGGQIKKMQMMRSVFIIEKCPKILLLDETMGALDPESKELIQTKLSEHCRESIVITVHHYDNAKDCVPDNGFFDHNIHFENGVAFERELCGVINEA